MTGSSYVVQIIGRWLTVRCTEGHWLTVRGSAGSRYAVQPAHGTLYRRLTVRGTDGSRHVVERERDVPVVGGVERHQAGRLLARPVVVQLLEAVERRWLVVEIELVREHLVARSEQRQVADPEDTDLLHPLAVAVELERPAAPVLEAREERLRHRVRLRLA